VDVDVPGSGGSPARVFRVGIARRIRAVRGRICGHGDGGRDLVHVAPQLGSGRGTGSGQQASGDGGGAATHGPDRRRGAAAISAAGFGTREVKI